MPAIPLLSRGVSSSTSSAISASAGRGSPSYTSSSGSSSGYRGSGTSSSSGLLPGSVPPIAGGTIDTESSDAGDSKVAEYTVIGFFALVGFCIAAYVVYKCTSPCRMARKAQRATRKKETPASQATEKYRANREYIVESERERQAVEAAVIIQQSFPVSEPTRYNQGHRSVRPTDTSTMGSSAEVHLAHPEPAPHRTRANVPSIHGRPSTPLPKYERHDPLRKGEARAEIHAGPEESPSNTERDNSSRDVVQESH